MLVDLVIHLVNLRLNLSSNQSRIPTQPSRLSASVSKLFVSNHSARKNDPFFCLPGNPCVKQFIKQNLGFLS